MILNLLMNVLLTELERAHGRAALLLEFRRPSSLPRTAGRPAILPRERAETRVVSSQQVPSQPLLAEELVGESAGPGRSGSSAPRPDVLRVPPLAIAEDRVGESAEGIGGGSALVGDGARAAAPGAGHQVPERHRNCAKGRR